LTEKALKALEQIRDLGITTLECKSGYGLERLSELKQLQVYRRLDEQQAVELVPTFLGAHMVPDEYQQRRSEYIDLLCQQLIPEVAEQELAQFCDIFVEQGAYSVSEARQILSAAQGAGLKIKVHADQLSCGGGAQLAAEFGAVSAEHLEYADEAGIQALERAGTVAVSLPLASLYLRERYLPAREMLNAGVRVAVATDFNPGSAPSFHLPLAMTLACINQQMTPQEVLMGATSVAARAIAAEHRIGSYHFQANACCGLLKSGRWQKKLF
jgi:imidazolonepropionase